MSIDRLHELHHTYLRNRENLVATEGKTTLTGLQALSEIRKAHDEASQLAQVFPDGYDAVATGLLHHYGQLSSEEQQRLATLGFHESPAIKYRRSTTEAPAGSELSPLPGRDKESIFEGCHRELIGGNFTALENIARDIQIDLGLIRPPKNWRPITLTDVQHYVGLDRSGHVMHFANAMNSLKRSVNKLFVRKFDAKKHLGWEAVTRFEDSLWDTMEDIACARYVKRSLANTRDKFAQNLLALNAMSSVDHTHENFLSLVDGIKSLDPKVRNARIQTPGTEYRSWEFRVKEEFFNALDEWARVHQRDHQLKQNETAGIPEHKYDIPVAAHESEARKDWMLNVADVYALLGLAQANNNLALEFRGQQLETFDMPEDLLGRLKTKLSPVKGVVDMKQFSSDQALQQRQPALEKFAYIVNASDVIIDTLKFDTNVDIIEDRNLSKDIHIFLKLLKEQAQHLGGAKAFQDFLLAEKVPDHSPSASTPGLRRLKNVHTWEATAEIALAIELKGQQNLLTE